MKIFLQALMFLIPPTPIRRMYTMRDKVFQTQTLSSYTLFDLLDLFNKTLLFYHIVVGRT